MIIKYNNIGFRFTLILAGFFTIIDGIIPVISLGFFTGQFGLRFHFWRGRYMSKLIKTQNKIKSDSSNNND